MTFPYALISPEKTKKKKKEAKNERNERNKGTTRNGKLDRGSGTGTERDIGAEFVKCRGSGTDKKMPTRGRGPRTPPVPSASRYLDPALPQCSTK